MSENGFYREHTIGGLPVQELMLQLENAGVQFNKYASILFGHRMFSHWPQRESVSLYKMSLEDLGLKESCSLESIIERGSGLGLSPCPLYLGAYLRLEYLNQPAGPYLTIVSPRLSGDETEPCGFYLRNHENSLWLRGYRSVGESEWPVGNEYIFLKP